MAFWNFFTINLKMIFRDTKGVFWTLVMPGAIYTILSVLPIGKMIATGVSYRSYLLPGLLAMTIMQGGIYGLAYWMVDLKARGVLKRFTVAPVTKLDFIAGVVSARLVVMFLQVIILSLLGVLVFGASFNPLAFLTFIYVIIGGSIFLMIGLLISTVAGSYVAAAPITAGIGLPLTFLGNIFYPVDNLPKVLQWVAHVLPITYMSDIFRMLYLNTLNLSTLLFNTAVLLVWFVVISLLVAAKFNLKD
jgi:ABC-2 type transport system permease protein